MKPFRDAIAIMAREWKLLAGLNALYFCVLVIGATIALISPGLHQSMIELIGAQTIAGTPGTPPSDMTGAMIAAGQDFFTSFFMNTLGLITIPSIVLPIWGPIIGAARFFIWGVTYVSPLAGVMTLEDLIPQYVAMLLEGEAYIIAIFACVRQLTVALTSTENGLRWVLKQYIKAVFDSLKLLLIVVVLLAIASLYQAFVIPAIAGLI